MGSRPVGDLSMGEQLSMNALSEGNTPSLYLANKSSRFFTTVSAYQWSFWVSSTTWLLPSRPGPSLHPITLPNPMIGAGAWY